MSRIPFDIKHRPQIESGEYKVETGDGKPVRIISWDKNGFECKEIVTLVTCATGTENCNIYTTDGRLRSNPYQENMKLFIVTPQEEMKEVSENVIVSSFIADLGKRYPEVSFAKLARIAKAAYDFGKAEALNDLPRWRTIEEATVKRTDDNDCVTTETMLISERNRNHYGIVGPECMVNRKTLCIPVVELSKLPGFKEE